MSLSVIRPQAEAFAFQRRSFLPDETGLNTEPGEDLDSKNRW